MFSSVSTVTLLPRQSFLQAAGSGEGKAGRRGSGRHGGRTGQIRVEPDCELREGRDSMALMSTRPDTGPALQAPDVR